MQITSSYGVEILKLHSPLKKTMQVSREAVSWLLPVIGKEWEKLKGISGEKKRFNAAEKLIHGTRNNRASYPFDEAFPKMPSYLRRAILQHVIGRVSAADAQGRKKEYAESAGERAGKKPGEYCRRREQKDHYMPVFYRDNMYRREEGGTYLKLYNGSDWVWYQVRLKKTDMDYLKKKWTGKKEKSPVLVRRNRKYFLQFAFEEQAELRERGIWEQKICAVDLGINTDAVCSIMRADGTVAARRFISFPAEKDRLSHVLGRIRKKQGRYGSGSIRGLWSYAGRLNDETARRTAGGIVDFAREYGADVIVFEHLEMHGRIRGKKRQRLHMWKKDTVQKVTEHHAHRHGIRIRRVCAWNTSALAYDGSGPVARDEKNHSLATFQNGKRYNCDLSATYNIGARYFIREILKTVPETEQSLLAAKVPGAGRRTSCVYADLLRLAACM